MRGKNLVNVLLFQSAWFAAVMGAARGFPWLGPAAVTVALRMPAHPEVLSAQPGWDQRGR